MIYDEVAIDIRWRGWPAEDLLAMPNACPICSAVEISRYAVRQYTEPICAGCWMMLRHEQPEQWHCARCKKFLDGLDRYMRPVRDGVEFLCRDHFAAAESLEVSVG